MDIHNIDEYLDLQDQNQMNLLATEELSKQPEEESEWHSATAAALGLLETDNPYLYNVDNNTNNNNNEWVSNQDSFITPDSLLKQPTTAPAAVSITPVPVVEEKRVTRSRNAPSSVVVPKKKKKAARQKKLYCICQQPYSGKPMVQCDTCEEWFHCTCVGFDPDEQEDEDIDWVCQNCLQVATKPEPVIKSPTPKVTITIPSPSARQTRGANRTQSQCLSEGCHNRTRADSYCSDVCARKKHDVVKKQEKEPVKEKAAAVEGATVEEADVEEADVEEATVVEEQALKEVADVKDAVEEKKKGTKEDAVKEVKEKTSSPATPQRVTRLSRMRTASMSASAEPANVVKPKRRSSAPVVAKKKEVEVDNKPALDGVQEEAEEEEEEEEEEEDEEMATPDTPMSPSQMTEQENPVRRNVIKNMSGILKRILDTAIEENPQLLAEGETSSSTAESLAKRIENTMLEELGDVGKTQNTCGERYKSKFRSLLYNLKDKQNQVFQMRVITGDLDPMQLVKMSSEDMANPELKSMSEVMRKAGLKNSVMKVDNTPIIKKTHKGDIIMVPNKDNDTNQNMYSEQVEHLMRDTPTINPLQEETKPTISSFSPTSNGSKLDPLDDILARIGIPAHDDNNKRSLSSSDSGVMDYPKKRRVTLDMEELLGEEEDTPFTVEEVELEVDHQPTDSMDAEQEEEQVPAKEKLPSIWHGRVNMPAVAEFEASARQIGGRILTEEEWAEVLSPTMWIEGRIPAERVTGYVTQSQYSNSREIVLLEIEPDSRTEDATNSQTLLKYLDSRQRYAVVGHNKTKVKDFYLIPLYKVQHIPDCLYVVRVEETERECDLFLGVLVLTKQIPVVTKPAIYSTPMATPMYLAPSPPPPITSQFETPSQPSYYNSQEQPKYGYGHAAQTTHSQPARSTQPAPQESFVHPSRQQQHNYERGQGYYNNQRQRNRPDAYRPSY
ncbi:transcription factor S-II, central domain-containing protein [Mucor mucedo]|uniref:transcription factor S-II, central domain-containing protein n=1 Tax=Mucor mucedo TaxID=29922 RepID=UPI00221FE871|nr:transcription factor S-II, central domain-containing protein [Mucor mucedo]KAI7889816.1 transcription factor S-II, central domain-containing protein [Mucor mucedo]